MAFKRDGVSVELFNITLNIDPALRRRLLNIVVCNLRAGEVPQQWKDTIMMVPHKKKGRVECAHCRGISLVAHAAKTLLNILACHFSESCKRLGILRE